MHRARQHKQSANHTAVIQTGRMYFAALQRSKGGISCVALSLKYNINGISGHGLDPSRLLMAWKVKAEVICPQVSDAHR